MTATINLGAAQYTITIRNPGGAGSGIASADLDGASLAADENGLTIPLRDGVHQLQVVLGPTMAAQAETRIR